MAKRGGENIIRESLEAKKNTALAKQKALIEANPLPPIPALDDIIPEMEAFLIAGSSEYEKISQRFYLYSMQSDTLPSRIAFNCDAWRRLYSWFTDYDSFLSKVGGDRSKYIKARSDAYHREIERIQRFWTEKYPDLSFTIDSSTVLGVPCSILIYFKK
jgi:hypothetical protein